MASSSRESSARSNKKGFPRDTVVLHQIGRGKYAPSISPFPIKLETYLRFANIPYVSVHGTKTSSKGKIPWIEFNGEVVNDTSFIIDFLNKKFNVDLNSHLSPTDRAIARAFQKMVEENLFWSLVYSRWFDKQTKFETLAPNSFIYTWVIATYLKNGAKKNMHGHGIGRHSKEEIYHIAEKDIRALSVFLGDKCFLFGDEPCEEDCAVFGLLSQFVWQSPATPQEALVKGDCKNLEEYCYRMKERFWPDWEQCILGDRELRSFIECPDTDPSVMKKEDKE
ncbi:failed axon connections homolog [Ptychodera flava]|uniref:failed axon connections homolog n=1 Tax=Ptychodera flava TaxID=63121 RepID=UPI00396A073E